MTETMKPTTFGTCHLCGSGSCLVWRHAALTFDGKVDHDALLEAHNVSPDDDAAPLVPTVHKPTATFVKHGGRVGPLQPKFVRKGNR